MDVDARVKVVVRLPPDLAARLEAACPWGTKNRLVCQAIECHLDKLDEDAKQAAAIQEQLRMQEWERNVADARLRAQALGDAMAWDEKRIEEAIVVQAQLGNGLVSVELVKSFTERQKAAQGDAADR